MDSIVDFQRLLGALRFYGSRRPSGRMNVVKTKRILTGLPDDRKNFLSFTGDAAQKMSLRMRLNNLVTLRSAVGPNSPPQKAEASGR
jgi:hypothetical protein